MTGRLLLRRPLEDDGADALTMLQGDGTHVTWHAVDRSSNRLVANCSVFAIDRDHSTTCMDA
jgi:hypothetical protein